MKPSVQGSEIIHTNPWYRIRHDKLTWTSGKPGEYFVIETRDTVIVMAIKDDQIMVIKQFRHAVDKFMLEFPGGSVNDGETPLEAAKHELQEEAGLNAEHWTKLGELQVLSGLATMKMHVFLAQEHTDAPVKREDSEESLVHSWMSIDQWTKAIADGTSTDSESLAAWALYKTISFQASQPGVVDDAGGNKPMNSNGGPMA